MDLLHGNSADVMRMLGKETVDLVITSPPYDKLRNYKDIDNFQFNFIADELVRILKPGGVIVWVVNDATVDGSETCTSFKQALYFKSKGLNLHDTMIFAKNNPIPQIYRSRYNNEFEYMFVFSKGKPKTHNPIKIPTKNAGKELKGTTYKNYSKKDQKRKKDANPVKDEKIKGNIWYYTVGVNAVDRSSAKLHPATFPYQLAEDHILSWSNEGDVVLDPMMGSGTVGLACQNNNREFIGIEVVEEYFHNAKHRLVTDGQTY